MKQRERCSGREFDSPHLHQSKFYEICILNISNVWYEFVANTNVWDYCWSTKKFTLMGVTRFRQGNK